MQVQFFPEMKCLDLEGAVNFFSKKYVDQKCNTRTCWNKELSSSLPNVQHPTVAFLDGASIEKLLRWT